MKNLFKRKKDKFPKEQVPRDLKEIQAAYNDLSARAGQIQYQRFVLDKDLEYVNNQLVSVNQEAHARKELDKASAEAKPKEESKQ